MDVHFVLVAEVSPAYLNMAELLLYSLRVRGGVYSESPVTLVTNGVDLPLREAERWRLQYGPIELRAAPRQMGTPFRNKFNALYSVCSDYDVLIYLDCDIAVLNRLDDITRDVPGAEHPFLAGLPRGAGGYRGYELIVRQHSGLDVPDLAKAASNSFSTGYPLFQGGVLLLTMSAVKVLRASVVSISEELGRRRTDPGREHFLFRYNDLLRAVQSRYSHNWLLPRLPALGRVYYPQGDAEQMSWGLAAIRHGVESRTLPRRFNWNGAEMPADGALPALFHYMKGLYSLPRGNLLDGDWVDEYLQDSSPVKRAFGEVVLACKRERNQ